IKLWEVATGRELRTLTGHSGWVTSVAFTADGKTLASGSHDQTIKLWEVATGRELRTLTGHSDWISSVKVSADGKFLVSGSGDATIKFWRVDGGELLASLVALDKADWACVTPSGLFDASPGGKKLMHYVAGMEVVTLEQMKDLYYVPGLLQEVMAGKPLPKVELFTGQDLFPEAEYEHLKPDQKTFIVKLRNRGGGIGPAQVLVNGTEVIADARPPGFDPQAKEATLTIDRSNFKQLLPGQENSVEVIASNAAGFLSSKSSARGVKLVFVGEGKALTEPPQLYAIVGGVADFVDKSLHLQYSAKDAEDFARALLIGAAKFLGQDKVHIRLLTSDSLEGGKPLSGPDSTVHSATKENFRKVFAEFAAKAKQNDILVVYLSGHGIALKLNQDPTKPGGDAYLYLTREVYTTAPSALADDKIRTATMVSSEELVQWIKEIPALKKALVLDTCAAGATAESLIAKRDVTSDQIRVRALERLKDRSGFFVLMGSAADKVSYETTTYRQGLLTYSLLEGLKGAKLHDGGYANVGQLFDYAQDRVPQLAQNIRAIQQPRSLAADIGTPFDIGLYTADEQKLFSLPSPNPVILRPSLQNKDLGLDDLKLAPALQRALLEASYVSTRGASEPSLVFVDAGEMQDAFMPVGLYTVAGDMVTINLNLIRNDKRVATVMVEGTVTDEQRKAALVQKVIAAIIAETQKSIH
ncbi:MAG: caspase family protein, partial [Pyrinomonadaceae bacterium]